VSVARKLAMGVVHVFVLPNKYGPNPNYGGPIFVFDSDPLADRKLTAAAVGLITPYWSYENDPAKEALGNKAVKRSLHSDLFQMDFLGAD
jgi:hypothetical protein